MATAVEEVAKTTTDGRAYTMYGAVTQLIDENDECVGLENNLTILGWHIRPGDCLMLSSVLGISHADALERIRGCADICALEADTREWRMSYRQVAMALPEGCTPMMLHITKPITPAGVTAGSQDVRITAFRLDAEQPTPHTIDVSEKLCLQLMRSKAAAQHIEFLNEFCGAPIFRVTGIPSHVRKHREKMLSVRGIEPKPKENKKEKADVASLSAADIAAEMTKLAEPNFVYFQRKRQREEFERKREQERPQRAPKFRNREEDKLPEVAKLSRPQKDLIVLRLRDIGVEVPAEVNNLPLRRGRHTTRENAGVIEFSHAQLGSVNKALKSVHHELVFVEEHSVYALRNTRTNIQFAFTQRDWEFVQLGKEERRYSGR